MIEISLEIDQIVELRQKLSEIGIRGEKQMKDLEKTIENTECDSVIIGTPIDLRRVITIDKPSTRVTYSLQEIGTPSLETILNEEVLKELEEGVKEDV